MKKQILLTVSKLKAKSFGKELERTKFDWMVFRTVAVKMVVALEDNVLRKKLLDLFCIAKLISVVALN